MSDPILFAHRRLAAAILLLAARDARSGNGYAAEARLWLLCDPLAGVLLDSLELDRQRVGKWMGKLEPLAQPALL